MPPIQRAQPTYDSALFRRAPYGLWHRWDVEPFIPSSTAVGVSVDGMVNAGRWVVQCPFCLGAQLAHPSRTSQFFCLDCLNEEVGGQWVSVRWPAQPEAIEEVLERRPDPVTRNWMPGETVDDLKQENAERGVS